MSPIVFVVPGRIDARTGGSIYDRRMAEGLRRRGAPVEIIELDAPYPFPTRLGLQQASERFASIPDGAIAVVDGMVLGAIPDVIQAAAARLRVVALVHLPLASDPGMSADTAKSFERGEGQALAASSLIVVTGAAALPMLLRYSLPRDRVVVVEPGTDPQSIARGSTGSPLQLLCVATLNPGKGHEILVRALAQSTSVDWRLTCAGSLTRHIPTVDRVRTAIRALGIEDRVLLAGELNDEQLGCAYDASDLFVLATLRETYGMAVADALARGLPVVSTATGAIPALVGDSAGLIVPSGSVEELAAALKRVLEDSAFRAKLADGARQVRARLSTWDVAADRFHEALRRCQAHE